MSYDAIGERIKIRRLDMGLTGRELARRTWLSASFISQLERGKTNISLESLRLVAEHLEISILHFLAEELPSLESQPNQETVTLPKIRDSVVRADNRPQLHLSRFRGLLRTVGS